MLDATDTLREKGLQADTAFERDYGFALSESNCGMSNLTERAERFSNRRLSMSIGSVDFLGGVKLHANASCFFRINNGTQN